MEKTVDRRIFPATCENTKKNRNNDYSNVCIFFSTEARSVASETLDIIDSSQWTKKWVLHVCVICMGFEIQSHC
jgi:hypothetical protein